MPEFPFRQFMSLLGLIPPGGWRQSSMTENPALLQKRITLIASLHRCGSQTWRDMPPVPGYKQPNWQTILLYRGCTAVCSRNEIFLAFCSHPLSSLWENSISPFGEIVPLVIILAETSTEDWCSSFWCSKWCCAVFSLCYNTTQHRTESVEGMKSVFTAGLRNQCTIVLSGSEQHCRQRARLVFNIYGKLNFLKLS